MMLKKKTGLKGKQSKLDMDKDGEITAKDFKMMQFNKQKLRPNRGKNIKKK